MWWRISVIQESLMLSNDARFVMSKHNRKMSVLGYQKARRRSYPSKILASQNWTWYFFPSTSICPWSRRYGLVDFRREGSQCWITVIKLFFLLLNLPEKPASEAVGPTPPFDVSHVWRHFRVGQQSHVTSHLRDMISASWARIHDMRAAHGRRSNGQEKSTLAIDVHWSTLKVMLSLWSTALSKL